jgi:hypothetical protein
VDDAWRDQDGGVIGTDPSTEEGPAVRDAAATLARIAEDEAEADAARVRLASEPLPTRDPDDRVAGLLEPGECVHDLRRSAMLGGPGGDRALGYGGVLYLTDHRLLHLGQVTVTVQLVDIRETSIAGERLLVALRDGEGLTLEVDRPRHLRVEIAAAQRALIR